MMDQLRSPLHEASMCFWRSIRKYAVVSLFHFLQLDIEYQTDRIPKDRNMFIRNIG